MPKYLGEYEVEQIVARKYVPGQGYFYFIKWKDYDSTENTWEPPKNLVRLKADLDAFDETEDKKLASNGSKSFPKRKSHIKLEASHLKNSKSHQHSKRSRSTDIIKSVSRKTVEKEALDNKNMSSNDKGAKNGDIKEKIAQIQKTDHLFGSNRERIVAQIDLDEDDDCSSTERRKQRYRELHGSKRIKNQNKRYEYNSKDCQRVGESKDVPLKVSHHSDLKAQISKSLDPSPKTHVNQTSSDLASIMSANEIIKHTNSLKNKEQPAQVEKGYGSVCNFKINNDGSLAYVVEVINQITRKRTGLKILTFEECRKTLPESLISYLHDFACEFIINKKTLQK